MADTKISAYTELATLPAPEDQLVIVDDDDGTMGATGTTKHVKFSNLIGGTLAANLDTAANAVRSAYSTGAMAAPSITTETTGGFLAAATYYYVVTALDADGNELAKSGEANVTTTGSTSKNTISWPAPIPGAKSYRIYRGTSAGNENVYITTYSDRTATDWGRSQLETAGSPPSSGTLYNNAVKRNGDSWFGAQKMTIYQDWTSGMHLERSAGLMINIKSKQSGTSTDGHQGIFSRVEDRTDVTQKTITNAANNGGGLIRITATGHGYATGDRITVYGVVGTTEANGLWTITNIDADNFDLQGSTFTNAYVSGGAASNRGCLYGALFTVLPRVDRDAFVGANTNGDDCVPVVINNIGTAKATEALYIGASGGATNAYLTGVQVDAPTDVAFRCGAKNIGVGLNLTAGVFSDAAIRTDDFVVMPDGDVAIGAASPSFTLGTRGLEIRTEDGSQPELLVRASTAAAADASLVIQGRSGSADVISRIRVVSGVLKFGAATNHTVDFTQNAATRFSLNTAGNFAFADAVNVTVQTTTGTKWGTTTTGKQAWWNATPVAQDTGWTITNATSDKVLDCNAYTMDELADVVGTLINTLKTYGLLGA